MAVFDSMTKGIDARAKRDNGQKLMAGSEFLELPFDAPRRWALTGGEDGVRLPEPPTPPAQPAVELGLELFQSAKETTADGYTRWKAEAEALKKAQEAARRAAELPVAASDESGYVAWKAEAEEARRQFEKRWGVPLGKAVRLQLRGEEREREGVLMLDLETLAGHTQHLRLRLGSHRFAATQIERLVRL